MRSCRSSCEVQFNEGVCKKIELAETEGGHVKKLTKCVANAFSTTSWRLALGQKFRGFSTSSPSYAPSRPMYLDNHNRPISG